MAEKSSKTTINRTKMTRNANIGKQSCKAKSNDRNSKFFSGTFVSTSFLGMLFLLYRRETIFSVVGLVFPGQLAVEA